MKSIIELEEQIKRLQKQLDATYGCESCPGMPTLTNPEVSRAAFKAVFHDKPEYMFDDVGLSELEKKQAEQIKQLTAERDAALAEVSRQKDCIRGLTDQCAVLVVEKNSLLMDHGGALCDQAKIEMLEAMLAGDGALITGFKNDIGEFKSALREAKDAIKFLQCNTDGYIDSAREADEQGDKAIATINKVLGDE